MRHSDQASLRIQFILQTAKFSIFPNQKSSICRAAVEPPIASDKLWQNVTNRKLDHKKHKQVTTFAFGIITSLSTLTGQAVTLNAKQQLGQQLFFDTNLSTPVGQACASCHSPKAFFVDPDKQLPTSEGALSYLKGNRNAPTILYSAFTPTFACKTEKDNALFCSGGLFLDGRAATLEEQAKGPFLNPLEMANPNKQTVVTKVKQANYALLFRKVYGQGVFDDTDDAFNKIADALAAFERTAIFKPFSSKYDYYLAGKVQLTVQEKRGLKLFEDPDKGNCAACHPNRPMEDGTPPLFTDFTYDNLGVPRNPSNPFYVAARQHNPDSKRFVDLGLGQAVGDSGQYGKLKVPTLRNIAVTAPYMHNGYFKTLEGVVDFYSNRDIKPVCKSQWVTDTNALKIGCWPMAEVAENVNFAELGELNLSKQEINDIVAFLKTLTDHYKIKAH